MKKLLILAGLLTPLMSFAVPTALCGRVSYGESNREAMEVEGSGYQVRVDCSRNPQRQLSGRDPLAVILEIIPHHKAWITRYTPEAIAIAAKNGHPNPRNAVPYVCMEVEVNQDPCTSGARRVEIQKIYEMHGAANEIKKYLKN